MKTVWMLYHYATTEFESGGGRPYSISKYLRQEGYTPIVFCASTIHKTGDQFVDLGNNLFQEKEAECGVPYVFVRTRSYKGNGIKRILNMIDYFKSVNRVANCYEKKAGKPDIIYASSVHPLVLLAGIKLARRYKIKCICEVRDLWPESFIAYNVIKQNNPLIGILRWFEKKIYKKADALFFTMEGAYDYIRERRWEKVIPKEKVFLINNGVDLELFDQNKDNYKISDKDLQKKDAFKVVYTGSIRQVNNLDKLLDIAKLITNKQVIFLIWGDGSEFKRLKARQEDEKIANVVFKGQVNKKYIPYITSCSSLNIAHNTSSPLFRFGVSFNKIFDYLAAGRPILCDFQSKYNPVIDNNAGFSVPSCENEVIAGLIDDISRMDSETINSISANARKGAEKYDYKNLTRRIKIIIDGLCN